MYIPKQFQENRIDRLAEAMRDIELATVVTSVGERYYTSYIPMIFKQSSGEMFLEGHVARANDHWTAVTAGRQSIAIFMGPQAYISPSWYETKREHGRVVPTWNYLVVQAEGILTAIDSSDWLLMHLDELTKLNEAKREKPWHLRDTPEGFIESLSNAVVGLRLRVQSVVGCWKMIQHRSQGDRSGAITALLNSDESSDREVGVIMQNLEKRRDS
jgi:transcriptional regulator